MDITDHASPARFVDAERLWQRHMDMAAIGGFGETGVNRQAFSAEDIAARQLLIRWASPLGLDVHADAIGNLYLRHEPDSATAKN